MYKERLSIARSFTLLLTASLLSFTAYASGVDHLIVFGDSLSDNGNIYEASGGDIPPSPMYWNGRFSNGMVWADTLAVDIGATLSNFAIGGATTGTANVNDAHPAGPFGGLQNEIADYTGGTIDTLALHVVAAGSNNFLSIPADPVAAITTGVTEILTAVGTLKAVGVTKIWLFNLPDLGLTPRLINAGLSAQGTALTDAFNAALLGGLAQVGFTDVNVYDTAGIMREIVANPADFGLTNVTDACLAVGCTSDWMLDPDEFMFWDDIHPTRAVHGIIADDLRTTAWVPIPASAWLLGSALGLLFWVRARSA